MKKTENSILQKTLTLAEKLRVFCLEDLLDEMPNVKRATLSRYLSAMISNGNVARDKDESSMLYFISNKPIKTKIGD